MKKSERFISEDPIGLKSGDINFFMYVQNDPVNRIDPTGLGHPYRCAALKLECMETCTKKCNDTSEAYFKCIEWCEGPGYQACVASGGKGKYPENPCNKLCEKEKEKNKPK